VDEVTRGARLTVRGRVATHRVPLPGGDFASLDAELAAARAAIGSAPLAEHLVHAYGSGWREIKAAADKNPALAASVASDLPYIAAELQYAVEREMAVTLADLLVRRLHVAFETRDHGVRAAPSAARVVAPLLDWSEEQIEAELVRYGREIARIFHLETG
jgi:glycerol-3-phosphate dehydrogenase